jgi:hypothetical protein
MQQIGINARDGELCFRVQLRYQVGYLMDPLRYQGHQVARYHDIEIAG